MKVDLKDVTFLFLIRLDSIQRLENILNVTNVLSNKFYTNIILFEVSSFNNHITKSLLNKNVCYQFVEDKDPILYKTKYYNIMAKNVCTKYISIWDADIVIDKLAILNAVDHLRSCDIEVAYPYNGKCYEVSEIIRELYLKKNDIKILYRNKNKLDFLYNNNLVGGAVIVKTEKYFFAGMENEIYYGWGNDDYDRYLRFKDLNYRIYRTDNCLFHLSHPRNINSHYRSIEHYNVSQSEVLKRKSIT